MHVTPVCMTAWFLFPVVLRFLGKSLGSWALGLIPRWEYVGHVTGEGVGGGGRGRTVEGASTEGSDL